MLSSQDGEYLTIAMPPAEGSQNGLACVWYTQKVPDGTRHAGSSPFMRPRLIAKSETFSDAVHAADTFASSRFPWNFVQHTQKWRKMPATEGQLLFLNKFRDLDDHLTADQISKGKATDMITKIKFGAKGWFGRLEASRKREDRKRDRAREVTGMREREQVRIGPLSS